MIRNILLCSVAVAAASALGASSCRFAKSYSCESFRSKDTVEEYLDKVAEWEGRFATEGIGYDAASGYTYDGHPIDYNTGELFGEPHLFSAPSKESIHVGILALAVGGDKRALKFAGGMAETLRVLSLKMDGYMQFNKSFPGFGCFTPWVGFNSNNGTFTPLESWSTPYYRVPGLDNGEWFWALYAVTQALYSVGNVELADRYNAFVSCQKKYAKTIFYRGEGGVSDVVNIMNAFILPVPENYQHIDGYLNDPYEGETMTQLLYLFSHWDSEEERDMLWTVKRDKLKSVSYIVPPSYKQYAGAMITVQEGFWFSSHEQWKVLLMPYFTDKLTLVKNLFYNAEVARTMDAYVSNSPGLLASINDVTDGSQDIPDYISAAGIEEIASQEVTRRDVLTPYGSFGLMMHNISVGLCWYNNMLQGSRMQSAFGSTEAINVNGTEICPLTTWDSKITTVLAMLGGVGSIVEKGLQKEFDSLFGTSFDRFVYIVDREYSKVFGKDTKVPGNDIPLQLPKDAIPNVLSDWELACA